MKDQNIEEIFRAPLFTLVNRAAAVHRENFRAEIQASALLSVKTGGCPENCAYCPQSAHFQTGVKRTPLLSLAETLGAATQARAAGATRFCLGAAWREVKDGPEFDRVLEMVAGVKALGLETCCTLGMLNLSQAERLREAGLDFYNHNIDTSPGHYAQVIQTRQFNDRLNTISHVRLANLKVCTGGILGLGESEEDRLEFIRTLVKLDPPPESITINTLVPIPGTPLADSPPVDPLDIVRVIAALRVLSPASMIRLSAGRLALSAEAQFLCFLAGANSIFLGEKLLTSPNPEPGKDKVLLERLGLSLA